MGWDSSRPVPWNRLIREWLIYAAIMSAVFVIFFRGDNVLGAIAGVLISGPLYLAFGAVMAKFGYSRTRLKGLRSAGSAGESEPASTASGDSSGGATPRPRPAPTSRTAGGGNRPKSTSRRKR
jgi:uncharacterized membrane protein YgcG